MSLLPDFVVFSITGDDDQERYLGITGPEHQLRFGPSEGVFSVTAKFAVEPAANGLVHIRSCYDNKYWVRVSKDDPWLMASASKAVSDQEDEGCTLFRPQVSPGNVSVSFVHAKNHENVVMRSPSDAFGYNLRVEHNPPTRFTIVNYSSLIKLPKYVMIKSKNQYLVTKKQNPNDEVYLINQPDSKNIGIETFVTKNGDLHFKSRLLPKKWAALRKDSYLCASYPDYNNPTDPNMIQFKVLHCTPTSGSPGFAFCPRAFGGCFWSNRSGSEITISQDSKDNPNVCFIPINLGIPEKCQVTLGRQSFRNGRVYHTTPELKTGLHEFKNTSDQDRQEEIKFDKDLPSTLKYTFRNSVTTEKGMANFSSPIPILSAKGEVDIPKKVESLGFKTWGQTYDYDFGGLRKTVAINVPAKSRVTVHLSVRTDTCEIPFSYHTDDEFFVDGTAHQELDDGTFTGEYTYTTEFKIQKESIPATSTQD